MGNVISNYNIHDIVKFKINSPKKFKLIKDFNPEFAYFKVDEIDNEDIQINIGDFSASKDDCYVIDDKYYVKDNYFYCKDYQGKVNWQVEIKDFEKEKTIVNFNPNTPSIKGLIIDIPLQTFLIEPLINYKLSKKGHFLIHSGAISKDDTAYLLAGRGGAFKTTLTMDFIRNAGFKYLGDDKVIIHKNKVLCYPASLISFNFRLKHLPTEKLKKVSDRIKLFKYYLDKNNYIDDLTEHVLNKATIKKVFFMVKKKRGDLKFKQNLDFENCINRLMINNIMEMNLHPTYLPSITGLTYNHFYIYMLAYSYMFPTSSIAKYWDDLKAHISKIFKKVPFYEIELPDHYDNKIFNKVYDFIIND